MNQHAGSHLAIGIVRYKNVCPIIRVSLAMPPVS